MKLTLKEFFQSNIAKLRNSTLYECNEIQCTLLYSAKTILILYAVSANCETTCISKIYKHAFIDKFLGILHVLEKPMWDK